eukprot:TRINITY_DN14385_c0_g1_i1.p1 TRINITY_DN14385_c0_g1~~TRINITY_DN14385_c0_g1_i1.p1  ORF type:complete len:326 (+),score=59.77 TRINITY_DN14385_c0_g1_i1:357-1334(+)
MEFPPELKSSSRSLSSAWLSDRPFLPLSLEDCQERTLKESLSQISSVPHLEQFLSDCEQVAKKFENGPCGLTHDEATAVVIFVLEWQPKENSLSHHLNSALQEKTRTAIVPFLPFLKIFLSAISKLQQSYSKTQYVCEGFSETALVEGTKVWSQSFTKCISKTPDFMNQSGSESCPETIFQINFCDRVVDIHEFSFDQHQQDILLVPGRQCTVKRVDTADKTTVVELVEVVGKMVAKADSLTGEAKKEMVASENLQKNNEKDSSKSSGAKEAFFIAQKSESMESENSPTVITQNPEDILEMPFFVLTCQCITWLFFCFVVGLRAR